MLHFSNESTYNFKFSTKTIQLVNRWPQSNVNEMGGLALITQTILTPFQ